MSKMIIMKGLPASGKSTKAQEIMIKDGNAVRINKDLIRTMLHYDKFNGKNEGHTRDAARTLAKLFLSQNKNVIIDDTNLNPGTMQSWQDLAKEIGCKYEVIDLTDVPLEDCIARDRLREKMVGPQVIRNMAIRYGITKFPKAGVVLCDIDGTIADTSKRVHHVQGEKKDWKSFFGEMGKDAVRWEVMHKVRSHPLDRKIIFVTARPEQYREETIKWLAKNGIDEYYTIIMRKDGDTRADVDIKKDILDDYFPDKEVISKVFDDRPSVIRMWREQGLEVVDVGDGKEF